MAKWRALQAQFGHQVVHQADEARAISEHPPRDGLGSVIPRVEHQAVEQRFEREALADLQAHDVRLHRRRCRIHLDDRAQRRVFQGNDSRDDFDGARHWAGHVVIFHVEHLAPIHVHEHGGRGIQRRDTGDNAKRGRAECSSGHLCQAVRAIADAGRR